MRLSSAFSALAAVSMMTTASVLVVVDAVGTGGGNLRSSSSSSSVTGAMVHRHLPRAMHCGCPEYCTSSVLGTTAGSGTNGPLTCLDQIDFLTNMEYSEYGACKLVATVEFQNECGGCDPDGCTEEHDEDCDMDGDGHMSSRGRCASKGGNDCNDNDPTIHPDADEVCGDAKDNDCNGFVDEICQDEPAPGNCTVCALGTPHEGDECAVDTDCGGSCTAHTHQAVNRRGKLVGIAADPGDDCDTDTDCPVNRGRASQRGFCEYTGGSCVEVSCEPNETEITKIDSTFSSQMELRGVECPVGLTMAMAKALMCPAGAPAMLCDVVYNIMDNCEEEEAPARARKMAQMEHDEDSPAAASPRDLEEVEIIVTINSTVTFTLQCDNDRVTGDCDEKQAQAQTLYDEAAATLSSTDSILAKIHEVMAAHNITTFDAVAVEAVDVSEKTTTSTNVTVVDECAASSPCQNGGTCANQIEGEGYSCACSPGFTGTDCETETNIDECDSSPCLNGGACTEDGVGSFACECAGTGFTGTTCETDIDDCAADPSPCLNGASCVDGGVNSFICDCAGGFTGSNCETDINECDSSPCQNGGTCADGVDGFACECSTGYFGTECATDIDDCASLPCQNGGACTDIVNGYTCACSSAFEGTQCETAVVTSDPTGPPSDMPSGSPVTGEPSDKPSGSPVTGEPSDKPIASPVTGEPSDKPSTSPVTGEPSDKPSASPVTGEPSDKPSGSPFTGEPSNKPSGSPVTGEPSDKPSASPSDSPSNRPSACNIDADCSNGNLCDGPESCDSATRECVSGTAVDCNDDDDATVDSCRENATDHWCESVVTGSACDPDPCNGGSCTADGATYTCECWPGTNYVGQNCATPPAQFMSGEYGVGFRIQGGNYYEFDAKNIAEYVDLPYPAQDLYEQFANFTIKPKWFIFGLSAGADGLEYTAPHPDGDLTNCYDYVAGPRNATLCQTPTGPSDSTTDNFYQFANWIKQHTDIKVIVYMASEGPAKLLHCDAYGGLDTGVDGGDVGFKCDDAFDWDGSSSPAMDDWHTKVVSYGAELGYTTSVESLRQAYREHRDPAKPGYNTYNATSHDILQKAYAEKVVKRFAQQYENLIDGYWFDHATDYACNRDYITDAIRSVGGHQADVPIAFQHNDKVPLANRHPGQEDYTGGHPNPLRGDPHIPPYDCKNEPMVDSIENNATDGYFVSGTTKSLGHMFLPTNKDSWNRLLRLPGWDNQMKQDKAIEWMHRVKVAGGAWSWNPPMMSNNANNCDGNDVEDSPGTCLNERDDIKAWGKIDEAHIAFLETIVGRLKDVVDGNETLPAVRNCDIVTAAPTSAPTEPGCSDDPNWEYRDGSTTKSCSDGDWLSATRCCRECGYDTSTTALSDDDAVVANAACCNTCSQYTCTIPENTICVPGANNGKWDAWSTWLG